jgi:hypothetical protein
MNSTFHMLEYVPVLVSIERCSTQLSWGLKQNNARMNAVLISVISILILAVGHTPAFTQL